jgi:hypothetical protein
VGNGAKTEATREKRLKKALKRIAGGKIRNLKFFEKVKAA